MASTRSEDSAAIQATRARADIRAVLDLVAQSVATTAADGAQWLVDRLSEAPGIRSAQLSATGRRSDQAAGRFAWRIGTPPDQRTLYIRTVAAPPDAALVTALDAFARVIGETHAEKALNPVGLEPQLLRAMIENARGVVMLVWPDGALSSISPSFSAVLGYESDLDLRHGVLDLIHRDDRADAVRLLRAAFAHRPEVQPVDLRLRTASGDWVILETRIRGLLDDPPVGAVVFYGMDVTARRQIELGLRGERQRLTQVIQTLEASVLLLDQQQNIVVLNRAFAAMFYLLDRADSLAGRPLAELLGELETLPDPAALLRQVEQAHAGTAAAGREITLLDGRVLELDIVPVGRSNDELGTLLYLRDVTERAAVRTGFERRNRTLVEATTLHSAFIANVAHELRSPLTSVAVFADFLTEAPPGGLSEEHRQFAEIIGRNSNRVLAVIEQLVLVAQLDSGGLRLQIAPATMADVVRAAVEDRQDDAELAQVALNADIVDGPPVRCDEVRLREVLAHLITNSLTSTPPGGAVTVRAAPVDTGWEINVVDSGIGVPRDELSRLFTPFYRASNVETRSPPGVGLGLSVSRAIIERHGGTIRARSVEGEGTTVTIWLPQRRTDDRTGDRG